MRSWRRVHVAAAMVAACALACAACSPPSPTAPPPTTQSATAVTPSPSPTTDPEAATKAQVLAAYTGFWLGLNTSLRDPRRVPDRRLFQYGTGKAVSTGYALVLFYRHRGIAYRGESQITVVVGAVDSQANATAKTVACVDISNWRPVFVKDGKAASAPDQLRRVTVTGSMVQEPSPRRWKLSDYKVHRDQPC